MGKVPTNKELLESVRDEFKQLENGDRDELDRLQNRGRMIIRRVIGENNDYYQRFVRTRFAIYASGVSEAENRHAW